MSTICARCKKRPRLSSHAKYCVRCRRRAILASKRRWWKSNGAHLSHK